MKTVLKIGLLIFTLIQGGWSQTTLSSNSPVNGSFIRSYTNQWKTTSLGKNGQKKIIYKRWTDYVQIIEIDGTKYLHRVQDLYNAQGQLTDTWTNMVYHQTLLPQLSKRSNPNGGFFHYEFTPKAIEGKKSKTPQGGEVITVNIPLQKPVYDWTLYGILLVGLPLKAQATYTLPIINFQTGKETPLQVQVKSQERVSAGKGKTRKAWRVETDKGLTFWLTKKVPYVIRLELKNKDATLVWEML